MAYVFAVIKPLHYVKGLFRKYQVKLFYSIIRSTVNLFKRLDLSLRVSYINT